MTFSYVPMAGDRDRMRFHLGDVDAAAARFSDEELDGALMEYTDWKLATLACIRSMIARLATPDFKADWLDVQTSAAAKTWRALLAEKSREFGVGGGAWSSGVTNVVRGDSDMTGW